MVTLSTHPPVTNWWENGAREPGYPGNSLESPAKGLLPQVGAAVVMETPWQHCRGRSSGSPPSLGVGGTGAKGSGASWNNVGVRVAACQGRKFQKTVCSPLCFSPTHTHTHTDPALDLPLELCWCPARTLWGGALDFPSLSFFLSDADQFRQRS